MLADPSGDWLLVDPGEADAVLATAGGRRRGRSCLPTTTTTTSAGVRPARRWPGVPRTAGGSAAGRGQQHPVGDGDVVAAGPRGSTCRPCRGIP